MTDTTPTQEDIARLESYIEELEQRIPKRDEEHEFISELSRRIEKVEDFINDKKRGW